jgi:hypothetical protein
MSSFTNKYFGLKNVPAPVRIQKFRNVRNVKNTDPEPLPEPVTPTNLRNMRKNLKGKRRGCSSCRGTF